MFNLTALRNLRDKFASGTEPYKTMQAWRDANFHDAGRTWHRQMDWGKGSVMNEIPSSGPIHLGPSRTLSTKFAPAYATYAENMGEGKTTFQGVNPSNADSPGFAFDKSTSSWSRTPSIPVPDREFLVSRSDLIKNKFPFPPKRSLDSPLKPAILLDKGLSYKKLQDYAAAGNLTGEEFSSLEKVLKDIGPKMFGSL